MNDIIPAILAKDYDDLKNEIALVRDHVSMVQLDIADGMFVPNKTWPFTHSSRSTDPHFNKILNEEEGLPFWEDVEFELDLMVSDAEENFDIYAKLGAKRLVFHIEAIKDLGEFKNFLEGIDLYQREVTEIGVAIGVDTPLENLYPLISSIDFVQCMGIDNIGFQGEEFDEKVVDKIKELREKYPDLVITVDGGITLGVASLLLSVGVNRLVVGSAIFSSTDIMGAIEDFRNID